MSVLTEKHKIVMDSDGKPESVIVPYDDYIEAFGGAPLVVERIEDIPRDQVKPGVPLEVANCVLIEDVSLVKAWREHLGLTQEDVAKKMGVTQATLSKMEASGRRHRKATIERLAEALGVEADQLRE